MNSLKKLFDLLSPAEQKHAKLLIVMILIMALLDVVGVASIMPFMAVLANPDLIEANVLLHSAYTKFGFTNQQTFLFVLGAIVFILLVVSLVFKAITTYAQTRFALMREYSVGRRLMEGYLGQPYSWFLCRHSADLGKTILSEVQAVINNGMMPLMTIIAQGVATLALLILLIVVDPKLAFSVGVVLGIAYGSIFAVMNSWLFRLGWNRIKANEERFKVISEVFGAVKEVKLGGLEQVFIQRFSVPAETYAKGQATAYVINQLPRYALEAIAFGGMLLVMLYLMVGSGSFTAAVPVIALYAFAGYRLMPALQQIYGALTQLRFSSPALDLLHTDLMALSASDANQTKITPMQITQSIELKKIVYRYPNATEQTLKNVDLFIPAKSITGFVGVTGSGKTTTVDVILGLLEPQVGALTVDGQEINKSNRREWQSAIGYVPQQIFLTDDNIAANIAFGIEPKEINQKAVEHSARVANLHNFIIDELPQGYKTTVGERGVRLSGGQRQRIGIARALYKNPKVLILDEATSALDNLTEQAVMEAVTNLGHQITIILIAHRLSTVRQCDNIYLFEHGMVKASGTYDELINSNYHFASMASKN